MIHQCSACKQRYLISDYFRLCDLCGSLAQQQIEKLFEADDAVEWWRLAVEAMGGRQSEGERRWYVS